MAESIGRDKSVISRERKRNSDVRNGIYKADLAQRKAQSRHLTKPKPYHSANENLNGLVRQYFPKMSNFDDITQDQID